MRVRFAFLAHLSLDVRPKPKLHRLPRQCQRPPAIARVDRQPDLEHDRADRGRRLTMPLLMLWGKRSSQGSGYDVLGVWRDHAENVRGHAIDSGHFIPEEAPDDAYRSLRDFFAGTAN